MIGILVLVASAAFIFIVITDPFESSSTSPSSDGNDARPTVDELVAQVREIRASSPANVASNAPTVEPRSDRLGTEPSAIPSPTATAATTTAPTPAAIPTATSASGLGPAPEPSPLPASAPIPIVLPAAMPSASPTASLLRKKPRAPVPTTELEVLKEYALNLINIDRAKHGLPLVTMGTNPAAQLHAEDMLAHDYQGHWWADGRKPYMVYSQTGVRAMPLRTLLPEGGLTANGKRIVVAHSSFGAPYPALRRQYKSSNGA